MRVEPTRLYYVTSKGETTIWFNKISGKKTTKSYVSFKGRLNCRPTISNLTDKIMELKEVWI